jgi:DNA-binding PadR family transcriptional regulator
MPITRTDLIILAFLSEKPSHGWEIDRQLVQMGANFWAEYSRPHLYYALRKLQEEGLLELVKPEKVELKKQYRVTDQGKSLLQDGETLAQLTLGRTYFDFDLLLGFSARLGGSAVRFRELLERRQERLQTELSGVQQVWQQAELSGELAFGTQAVIKHRIKFLKSELEFLKWLDKNTPDDWKSLNQPGGG